MVTPRRRMILLSAALLAVAGSGAALVSWWRAPGRDYQRMVEIASLHANTGSKVRYVGDSACTQCHGKIADTYHRHPMGRSLLPVDRAPVLPTGAEANNPFEAFGTRFLVGDKQQV